MRIGARLPLLQLAVWFGPRCERVKVTENLELIHSDDSDARKDDVSG